MAARVLFTVAGLALLQQFAADGLHVLKAHRGPWSLLPVGVTAQLGHPAKGSRHTARPWGQSRQVHRRRIETLLPGSTSPRVPYVPSPPRSRPCRLPS